MEEISTLIWDCKQSPHTDKEGKSRNSAHTSLDSSSLGLSLFASSSIYVCLSLYVCLFICLSIPQDQKYLYTCKIVYYDGGNSFSFCFIIVRGKSKELSNDIMIVKIFCSLFLLKTFLCISIRFFILLYFLFLCNDNTNTKLHVKQIVTCLPCPAVNVLRSIIHSPVVFLRGCKKQLNKLLQHDNQDT